MIRVAIIGATGYTGSESINLLLRHSEAELTYLSASRKETLSLSSVHPQLTGRCALDIEPLSFDKLAECADVALCCLPHKVSMEFVPQMLELGLKVVDFSADYRIKDIALYEEFYVKHTDVDNVAKAVYGLPELNREKIKTAQLVANPGCFPTSSTLALAPAIKAGLINIETIIVNSVSGTTGAGKKLADGIHHPNMNENLRSYAIGSHRHTPEMEQLVNNISGKQNAKVLFQPHIGPYDRGILSSIYCDIVKDITPKTLTELYREYYKNEPFVRIVAEPPSVKNVANTNYCHIMPTIVKGRIVLFSAIDNMGKGASSQAIQNMNIMFGVEETLGLL